MSSSSRARRYGRRARLIAACTGLASLAGMLLSQPAAADTVPPSPARALPRLDFAGDGTGEIMYRPFSGPLRLHSPMPDDPGGYEFHLEEDLPGDVTFKDYIPVGDQDGNGAPDFLVLSTDGTLTMVRTNGGGTWNQDYATERDRVGRGWQIYNKVLSPGDLNGDRRPDLLGRTPAGDVYFYPSTGDTTGPFGARVRIATGWQTYDQLVGVTDDDSDGVGDVVTRTLSGELFFHAGVAGASPTFKAPVRIGSGWGVYNQLAGGDDMDGDGHGDIVGRTVEGQLYVYKGLGQGGFAQRTLGWWGYSWREADVIAGAGGIPAYGKSRIQGLGTDGRLYSYQTLGNGLLAQRRSAPSPYQCGNGYPAGTRLITLASDVALDDRADMFAICNDGGLAGGSEGQYDVGSYTWGAFNLLAGPGDLTGDGKGDLLARDTSGNLYVYRSATTDYYPLFDTRVRIGSGWNAYDRIVGAGDYTGDGRADIVARTPSGDLYLYAGTGTMTAPFKARVKVGSGWQAYSKLAAIGDVDGDGRGDLLAADRAGDLYRYSSTGGTPGPASFRARVRIGTGWNMYRELH
ncbi:FG-GAP repeat domain-containing protein [Streptomyces sp. NPDC055815]